MTEWVAAGKAVPERQGTLPAKTGTTLTSYLAHHV